jgi:hypothetical protein
MQAGVKWQLVFWLFRGRNSVILVSRKLSILGNPSGRWCPEHETERWTEVVYPEWLSLSYILFIRALSPFYLFFQIVPHITSWLHPTVCKVFYVEQLTSQNMLIPISILLLEMLVLMECGCDYWRVLLLKIKLYRLIHQFDIANCVCICTGQISFLVAF